MASVTQTDKRTLARAKARQRQPDWLRDLRHDWPSHLLLGFGLVISAIPLLFMLNISLKSQGQFMVEPLGVTTPFQLDNYTIAWRVLRRSLLNTVVLAITITAASMALAAVAAYVFARFDFPGRELLYWGILAILFIPGILSFTPRFVLVRDLGLLNTYWVMILPIVAGAQIFQAIMLRSFFQSISTEILEAAWMDGAGVVRTFTQIVLPLSRPILATLSVMRVIDVWNEWLWPFITVSDPTMRPMALQVYFLTSDVGAHVGRQMAGYTLATIPLLILFAFASRQFVEGLTSGALKF
jgi:ABC-type glycerol-3-phosphate transport system permease component